MARTRNAKKAHRASLRKRVFNARRKRAIHGAIKALAKEGGQHAITMLPTLYQALDKAAKAGTIHPRKAARQKSRLSRRAEAAK